MQLHFRQLHTATCIGMYPLHSDEAVFWTVCNSQKVILNWFPRIFLRSKIIANFKYNTYELYIFFANNNKYTRRKCYCVLNNKITLLTRNFLYPEAICNIFIFYNSEGTKYKYELQCMINFDNIKISSDCIFYVQGSY